MKKENIHEEEQEKELTTMQRRLSLVTFIIGIVLTIVGLAATFSFSAVLWKADITWVTELFNFFVFSFLFITFAVPTAIIGSVISSICLIYTAKQRHGTVRKICIVLIMMDILFLISAIIVAVSLM